MAEKPVIGKQVAKCNFVANDEIWKDHCHREQLARKDWPDKWSFMSGDYTDLVRDEMQKPKKDTKIASETLKLPPIKVFPSPKPIPVTTARVIGWRSTDPQLRLEKYGRYCRGKGGLIRQLKWPLEGIQ